MQNDNQTQTPSRIATLSKVQLNHQNSIFVKFVLQLFHFFIFELCMNLTIFLPLTFQ